MTVNRFESIKRYIHFNDNEQMLSKEDPKHDSLFKIRPIVDDLLARYKTIPLEEVFLFIYFYLLLIQIFQQPFTANNRKILLKTNIHRN